MNTVRLISIDIRTGVLVGLLFLSIPSMSFGELVSPAPRQTNMAESESLHQQNESSERTFPSDSMGFRSAESDGQRTVESLVPLQRSLSAKAPELVETTDASGGTMIQLQGKFQCGLKVPQEQLDAAVHSPMLPVIP